MDRPSPRWCTATMTVPSRMARTSYINALSARAAKNSMCMSTCSGLPRIATSMAITSAISTETAT